jgi:hypothetical protein
MRHDWGSGAPSSKCQALDGNLVDQHGFRDLEVDMQAWFVWAWIFAVFAIAAVIVVRQFISGGNTSRGLWSGGEVPVSDGASGATTSDCSSSPGGDGGACGSSGG